MVIMAKKGKIHDNKDRKEPQADKFQTQKENRKQV